MLVGLLVGDVFDGGFGESCAFGCFLDAHSVGDVFDDGVVALVDLVCEVFFGL